MKGATALAVAVTLAAWSVVARAADGQLELLLRDCDSLSRGALEEHLALELATLGLANVRARLQLRCEQTSVAVELTRASGRRYPVAARVELDGTAKAARERLVALAASELIAQAERDSSETQPRRARPAAPVTVLPVVATPGAAIRSAKLPRSELFAAANAAFTGEPRAALWGGTLGTRWGVGRTWSVLFDTRDQLERSHGLAGDKVAAVRTSLASAERASGGERGTALNALATQIAGDAAGSSDAPKVEKLSEAIKALATAQ